MLYRKLHNEKAVSTVQITLGKFLIEKIVRDVKTTLFINYSDDIIKVSGSAQLYTPEPYSVQKSGEIVDFSYEGKLSIK